MAKREILDRLRKRTRSGTYNQRTAFFLMSMILEQNEFDSCAQLASHCADPDNLKSCLPDQTDREIFSGHLVNMLHNSCTQPATVCPGCTRPVRKPQSTTQGQLATGRSTRT